MFSIVVSENEISRVLDIRKRFPSFGLQPYFVGFLLFSSSKHRAPGTETVYRILDITNITIYDLKITIKSSVLLDVTDYKGIINTGLLNEYSKRHIEVNYTILLTSPVPSSLQIESRYLDHLSIL